MLPRLESHTVAELVQALQNNFAALKPNAADEDEAKLFSTVRFVTDALPTEWQPLLIPLSFHEGFVQGDLLAAMAAAVDPGWKPATSDEFLRALANASVLLDLGESVFEMHPALTSYLRSTRPFVQQTTASEL
jgi:hypothetical protein